MLREASFVRRAAQLEQPTSTLSDDAAAAPLWYIHSPVGLGQSALLSAVARRCAARAIPVWFVDARCAEALQIPFSIFRRYVHMTTVADTLWRWECQGDASGMAPHAPD